MCQRTIQIKNDGANSTTTGLYNTVPCGRCSHCLKTRIQDWVFRLKQEKKVSKNAYFVTLTYDDQHIPQNNGYYTLNKRHTQLFMKKLRYNQAKLTDDKIRYYLVGEYGSKTQRPHYHAIMFNLHDPQLVHDTWQYGQITQADQLKHDGGLIYCTSYILGRKYNDFREPEFNTQSQGLGKNYLTPQIIKWHKEDLTRCYVQDGAYKKPMPRYYRKKIYTDAELEYLNAYKQHMADTKIDRLIQELIDNHVPNPLQVQRRRKEIANHMRTKPIKVKL